MNERLLSDEEFFGAATSQAVPAPKILSDDEFFGTSGGGFRAAVSSGIDTLQQSYGSALEGVGRVTGIEGLELFGGDIADYNAEQIAGRAQGMTRLDEVRSLGSAAKFASEVAGQQVPQIGSSLAGAAAGAAIGSVVPIIGTTIGAGVGALAANLPFFYGQNRERQKEANLEAGLDVEVDEGAAALYAIPQAALDTLSDLFTVSGVGIGAKALAEGGGLLTKKVIVAAGKGAGGGVLVEVPTEIGQSVLERMQAGLPIDDEDAMKEYLEVGVAAGILGAGMGGAGGGVKEYRANVGGSREPELAPDEEAALSGQAVPVEETTTPAAIGDDVAEALTNDKLDEARKILANAPAARTAVPTDTVPAEAGETVEQVRLAEAAPPPETDVVPQEEVTPPGNQAPVSTAGSQTPAVEAPGQPPSSQAAPDAVPEPEPEATLEQQADALIEALARKKMQDEAETPLPAPEPIPEGADATQTAPATEPAEESVAEPLVEPEEPVAEPPAETEEAEGEAAPAQEEPPAKPEEPAEKPKVSTGELVTTKGQQERDRAREVREAAIADLAPELESLEGKIDEIKAMNAGDQNKWLSRARAVRNAARKEKAAVEKLAPELETMGFKVDDVVGMKPVEKAKVIAQAKKERRAVQLHEYARKRRETRKSEAMTENQRDERKDDASRADRGEAASIEDEIELRAIPGDQAGRKATRTAAAKKAKRLMDTMVPESPEDVTTDLGVAKLYNRLGEIIKEARKAGITIPEKVTEAVPNHIAWLSSVRTIRNKLVDYDKQSADKRKLIRQDVLEFLGAEALLRDSGDATSLREARKIGGGEAKGRAVATTDTVSVAPEATTEDNEYTETPEFGTDIVFTKEEAEAELKAGKAEAKKAAKSEVVAEPDPDASDVVVGTDKANTFKIEVRAKKSALVRGRKGAPEFTVKATGKVDTGLPKPQASRTQYNVKLLDAYGAPVFSEKDVADAASAVHTLGALTDLMHETDDAILEFLNDLHSEAYPDWSIQERQVQRKVTPRLLALMAETVRDVKVYVVPDGKMDDITGWNVRGFYHPIGDYIAVRESLMSESVGTFTILAHEGSHAALWHAISSDQKAWNALKELIAYTSDVANAVGADIDYYAFKNPHEFIAELVSNPRFQNFLSGIPLVRSHHKALGIPRAHRWHVRTVLNWVQYKIAKAFGVANMARLVNLPGTASALEVSMKLTGYLLELSAARRDLYYKKYPQYAAAAQPLTVKNPVVTVLPQMSRSEPTGNTKELMGRGMSRVRAEQLAQLIEDEFSGKVDAETLDALTRVFGTPVAVEGQLGASAKGDPPLPPQVTKKIEEAENPKEFGNASPWRAFLLKFQTLDYIVRRYRSLFNDDKGNAADDYFNATMEYDPTRRKTEDVHNRDWARIHDFARDNKVDGAKMFDLIAAVAPHDVNLGPNADNSHLAGNKKQYLQAKKALPRLNKMFNDMGSEAQSLFLEVTDNYRKTHNDVIRGTTYNILKMLKTPLRNDDVIRLMEATVDGTLTEDDKTLIGDETIWKLLQESKALKARKGVYFPSNRFGRWVVIHKVKVEPPSFNHFKLHTGKQIPLTHSVDDGVVTFVAGSSERGTKAAFDRAVTAYVEDHELSMLSYRNLYKNKKTGEIVSATNQALADDYDNVIQVRFQNNGVSFFESNREAVQFRNDSAKDLESGRLTELSEVEDRHEHGELGRVMNRTAHDAIMRVFDQRADLSDHQRAHLRAVVDIALVMQMPGNRYEKSLLKRRNVIGASKEAGRAAAAYGRAAGHHMAAIYTYDARRKAYQRMMDMRRGGAASQVLNEIEHREKLVGVDEHMNQFVENLVTIGALDKLASTGNWLLNGSQVVMNTLSVLGGRYGNARSIAAILSAYDEIGTLNVLSGGLGNLAKQAINFNTFDIDTNNLVESVRKKLGPKYYDLVDELVRVGDVTDDIGIENAAQLSTGRSVVGRALAKVDRIARQMPNAVEVVNRMVTAVATYNLALKSGKGKQAAIQEATDTVRLTQGRYDASNSPKWMRKPGMLRFFLVFKKFAQLQYQLLGDMTYRSFKGTSAKERSVARKQLLNLMSVNAMFVGLLALPGSELFKGLFMILSALGLTDDFEDEQEKLRAFMRDATGSETWEQILSRGLVSKAINVDLTTRMGWQDLVTGFAPKSTDLDDMKVYIANLVAGAPGGTVYDWYKAQKELREGNVAKFLELTVPIKQAADIAKAMQGVKQGKLTTGEGVRQAVGFRALRQSVISDKIGTRIRASSEKKAEVNTLIGNYVKAMTKAEVIRATSAIRQYNAKLPKDKRKIGIKGLEKLRRENMAMYQNR